VPPTLAADAHDALPLLDLPELALDYVLKELSPASLHGWLLGVPWRASAWCSGTDAPWTASGSATSRGIGVAFLAPPRTRNGRGSGLQSGGRCLPLAEQAERLGGLIGVRVASAALLLSPDSSSLLTATNNLPRIMCPGLIPHCASPKPPRHTGFAELRGLITQYSKLRGVKRPIPNLRGFSGPNPKLSGGLFRLLSVDNRWHNLTSNLTKCLDSVTCTLFPSSNKRQSYICIEQNFFFLNGS
jgi:hypothetical protein